MAKLTKYQAQAATFEHGNCLVSAGAGSGKTAVLTDRIHYLCKPRLNPINGKMEPICPLSKMLVLTFTNKAAYEMKARARQKIAADPETRHLLPEVEQAMITTFDGFALSLVKNYHYVLGLDENVTIVEDAIMNVERYRLIDQILERHFELAHDGKDDDFLALVKALCVKDERNIIELMNNAYQLAALKEDKRAFLVNYDLTFASPEYYQHLIDQYLAMIKELYARCKQIIHQYYNTDLADLDLAYISVIESCKTYDEYALAVAPLTRFPTRPKAKKGEEEDESVKEHDDALRDAMKNIFKGIKGYLRYHTQDEAISSYAGNHGYIKTIRELTVELIDLEAKFMKEHGCYRFEDIAMLARSLAKMPEIREKLCKTYSFIMVDEYQDTSDLQEDLINLISSGNTFCVGDIKQSIYRFRNANPTLFSQKLHDYGSGKGGTLIQLPDNFRSRGQVIDDINVIFSKIMTEQVGGANYLSGHALNFGNHAFDATASEEDYGIKIMPYAMDESLRKDEQEARLIVQDILYKIKTGFKVSSSKKVIVDGEETYTTVSRPCNFGDFAILTMTKSIYDTYMRVFNESGIPLAVSTEVELKDEDIYFILKNLMDFILGLKLGKVDAHMKHLFASISRSFIVGMKDEEIYHALHDGNMLDTPWVKLLLEALPRFNQMGLGEMFKEILEILEIPAKLPLKGDVMSNFERLETLYSAANTGSTFGWELEEFIAYFEDLDRYAIKLGVEMAPPESNAVKLMTIHASKGLQFKITYFPQLDRDFFVNIPGHTVLFENDLENGLGIANLDPNGVGDNIFTFIHKYKNRQEDLSEKMRLFYVALTRVEELGILVVCQHDAEKEKPLASAAMASSFRDFVSLLPSSIGTYATPDVESENEEEGASEVTPRPIIFRQVNALGEEIIKPKRPSKAIKGAVDEGALAFGTRLHRLLELSDLVSKDCQWINDDNERQIIEKVLRLPLFDDVSKAKIYKEYAFISESGQQGIIDLLLVYDDHAIIVDYKANNIDDDAYVGQLQSYYDHVSKVFHKPVQTYLLSILKAQLREVAVHDV